MCGIFGVFGKAYEKIDKVFFENLHHRGPDDKGFYCDHSAGVSIGQTRLAIIDLTSDARQPMKSPDGNYILVYNGEIYNFKEVRQELLRIGHSFRTNSDTEVVLHSYIQWGEECVKQFRGMFAFCIYDKRRNELFLARDRLGIKPLIYSLVDGQFVFSSELKPLICSGIVARKLSFESICDYFRFGSIRQPKTIIDNVFCLMPGHWMKINHEFQIRIEEYYNYVDAINGLPLVKTFEDAAKVVRQTFEQATRFHLIADVEVGAFLSSGIDSTAVVAMMSRFASKRINTFTIGFEDSGSIEDETVKAAKIAEFLECNHHTIKLSCDFIKGIFDRFIESLDQPSIDGFNSYVVSHEASKNVKVALSGLGGDEIFAGYPHFKTIKKYAHFQPRIFGQMGQLLNCLRANRFTRKFEYLGLSEEAAVEKFRTLNSSLQSIFNKEFRLVTGLKEHRCLTSLQRISKFEIDNYLLNTLLRDIDIASMANSLEVRPVLLDHRLVEVAFSIPDEFKCYNGELKSVFVESVKDLIPIDMRNRRKIGFEMPFSVWMNDRLNSSFIEMVNSPLAKKIFRADYLKNLCNLSKKRSLRQIDWLPFVFLKWINQYDGNIEI